MGPSCRARRVSASRPCACCSGPFSARPCWHARGLAAQAGPKWGGRGDPAGPRGTEHSWGSGATCSDGGISLLRPGFVLPACSPELGGGSHTQTFLLSYFVKDTEIFRRISKIVQSVPICLSPRFPSGRIFDSHIFDSDN